jgi:hypothetical protein
MLAILGVLLATTIAGGGFVVYEQRSADDLVRIAPCSWGDPPPTPRPR